MAPYWVLAAYAAGIALSLWLPPPDTPWGAALAALAALGWFVLRRRVGAVLPLAAGLVLLGFLAAHQQLRPPADSAQVSRFADGEPRTVSGTVTEAEQLWDGTTRLTVAVDRLGTGDAGQAAHGLVRLTLRSGGGAIASGERLSWRGRLRRPQLFGTPGEFDYPRHLAARGIFVTAYLERVSDLARESAPAAGGVAQLRRRLAARIAAAVPDPRGALVQALAIGSGSAITPEQRRVLAEAGLAHLFAISGLHFGLLALLLYAVAVRLYGLSEGLLLTCPPRRLLPLVLLLPLAGYLFLSGNATPTRRAFLMTALGSWLYSRNRRTPPLALLATVALLLLLISPLSLFEPSFQLSLAGVLGLLVWLPRWQRLLADAPAALKTTGTLLLTTLAASLTTAPFALWHFHQVAPAGLVTNLIAIPLVAWGAVPAALLGTLLSFWPGAAADHCFQLAAALAGTALDWAAWLATLPGLRAQTIYVTATSMLGVLLWLVAALLPLRRRLVSAALLAAGLCLLLLPAGDSARLRVVALSVGQGDATLLTLEGRHYLIDGGGLTGSTVDIGERLVAPALGRLGVRRLHGVIITHDHPDHTAGLSYLLEHLSVGTVWTALPAERPPAKIAVIIVKKKIPLELLPEGWSYLPASRQATLSLYVPSQRHRDLNDRSVVVHAASGSAGVLLPADLAARGFEELCRASLPAPVTLLKLAHHGSRGSQPEGFLDRLRPQLAFVSVGRDNSYRLPHPIAVRACSERGIPLYRTDHHGTLTFTSDGGEWQVATARESD